MDSNRGVKEQIKARVSATTNGAEADACNGQETGGPVTAGSQSPGSGILFPASGAIVALALASEDLKAVACALDALRPLLPLEPRQEEALEKRMLALIARGSAMESPELARAITHFLYSRAQQQASAVVPFVPALLTFLDLDLATTGAYSYYTLMILAENVPDGLVPFADALIARLAGPGYAARTLVVRIIAALAGHRPGSVANARDSLRGLVCSSGDEILKAEAAKALLAIEGRSGSEDGVRATAIRNVAVPASDQPAGHNRLLAVLAQFLNMWRVICRSRDKNKELSQISDDLQDVARWVEAEFPGSSDGPVARDAMTLPDKHHDLFRPRIVQPSPTVPALPVVEEEPPQEPTAPVNERIRRAISFVDDVETARLREMMMEVENDFSVEASDALDAMGIGHLKPARKDRAGDRMINAREFKLTLEKILEMEESQASDASPVPGGHTARPEEKSLISEIKRNIDDSLTAANEPVNRVAGSFLKPAEGQGPAKTRRPCSGSRPVKRRAPLKVHVTKKDGKIYRYYDRDNR